MKKKAFSDIIDSLGFGEEIFYEQGVKHESMQGYDLHFFSNSDILESFSGENKNEYDITVCYILWDNIFYVKYLYLSILSQILFTDVLKISEIKIIVGNELYPLVLEVFEPFFESDLNLSIKKFDNKTVTRNEVTGQLQVSKLNKYIVSLFEDIDSEVLILSDCENFFYGKQSEVYSNIWESYKNDGDNFPVLGCEEAIPYYSVFLNRRKDLSPLIYDDEEYINWFVKRLDVDENDFRDKIVNKRNNWFLTCFFIFDRDKFSPDDEEWREHVNWCSQYSFYCDETVYLTYAKCVGDYDIQDLSYIDDFRFVHSSQCENFYNKNNYQETGAFHPLHGSNSKGGWVQDFYDEIVERFDILVQKVLDKNSTIEQELPQY